MLGRQKYLALNTPHSQPACNRSPCSSPLISQHSQPCSKLIPGYTTPRGETGRSRQVMEVRTSPWQIQHTTVPPSHHHNHCTTLFNLPAEEPPRICGTIDVSHLPLSPAQIDHAIEHGFRASCSSGSSPMPPQLLRHICRTSREPLVAFFQRIAQ